jgi:hypothetical protein
MFDAFMNSPHLKQWRNNGLNFCIPFLHGKRE